MFSKLIQKLKAIVRPPHSTGRPIEVEYLNYLKSSYPNNHNYKVKENRLIPTRELAKRYKSVCHLFPDPLTSFVDVGSCKGFFVFAASEYPHCTRSMGIDVYQYDINVCKWLQGYLQNNKVIFQALRLHELAERIDEFGGPFQTALVLNQYHYLYFGSIRCPDRYLDHDEIFKNLSKICSQRLIFNNRVNLEDCQNLEHVALAKEQSQNYSEEKIFAAASKYFNVIRHGHFGGYPLWIMNVKENAATSTSSNELKEIFDKWANDFDFREQFKKNPEQALIDAGFILNADTLQKIKSMLKMQGGKVEDEELDKRINR